MKFIYVTQESALFFTPLLFFQPYFLILLQYLFLFSDIFMYFIVTVCASDFVPMFFNNCMKLTVYQNRATRVALKLTYYLTLINFTGKQAISIKSSISSKHTIYLNGALYCNIFCTGAPLYQPSKREMKKGFPFVQ